jgi:alkylation response protein AidB-like acyl-CoA dehydrogenase
MVRSWLERHPEPSPVELADAGFVQPGWPRPWGLDADVETRLIVFDELERAGIDPHAHNPIGIGWAGPTILAAGTSQQKERFLRPILTGEEYWCQLFSEPGAGSDLASLRTRAERDGDAYRINGQKIWSSHADRADFGILLARTNPDAPKHRGISYFLCPMDLPGIEVRPIEQMTGEWGFCEVFFTDVLLPAEMRVGPENAGWALAKLTLGNERVSLSTGGVLWGQGPTTDEVVRHLAGRARADNVELYVEGMILRLLGYRIVSRLAAGEAPGAEAAIKKLIADRHGQKAMEVVKDARGPEGMLDHRDVWDWGFLYSRALTIGGGTAEVLRNLIAENLLGLPRDDQATARR